MVSSRSDPEYSFTLDQNQSSGFATKPRRTGFRWMYSTALLYSLAVLNARSKKRPCQSFPASSRPLLICRVELTLIDSITREIVFGYRTPMTPCQWSGRKTHAVSRNSCSSRRADITRASILKSASPKLSRVCCTLHVTKKYRSLSTSRRSRDMRQD